MSNRIVISFLTLCMLQIPVTAQQTVVKGIISIHNSEFETGKRVFVTNAQVEDNAKKATTTVTNANGQFRLIYVGIGENKSVSFSVNKPGLRVVDETRLYAVAGQEDTVYISMASPEKLAEYRATLFKVGKTAAQKEMEAKVQQMKRQVAELKKDAKLNVSEINQLQNSIDQLEDEKQRIELHAEELARRFAPINLDDATWYFKQAFKHFQNGNADVALIVLQQIDLGSMVRAIHSERESRAKQKEKAGDRDLKLNRMAGDAVDALLLKAQLYRERFENNYIWPEDAKKELDSAIICYDQILIIDPENADALFGYAESLKGRLDDNESRVYYNLALEKFRRLSVNDPDTYEPQIARILSEIPAPRFVSTTETSDVEFNESRSLAECREATGLYRKLATKDVVFQPRYIATLLDLAQMMGRDFYSDPRGYLAADSVYLDCIAYINKLNERSKGSFNRESARVQYYLGEYYNKRSQFQQAIKLFIQAGIIYQALGLTEQYENTQEKVEEIKSKQSSMPVELIKLLETEDKNRRQAASNSNGISASLASSLGDLGTYYLKTGNSSLINKSWIYLEEASQIYDRLSVEKPAAYQRQKADLLYKLARYQQLSYNSAEIKILSYLKALEVSRQLVKNGDRQYQPMADSMQTMVRALEPEVQYDNSQEEELMLNTLAIYKRMAKEGSSAYNKKILDISSALSVLYGSRSWMSLIDANFGLAEELARKGLLYDPAQIWIKTNLAHALFFQNRYQQATKIYDELKTKKDENGRSYIAICLEDLDVLEKKKITSKDVSRLRKYLIE